MLFEDGGFAFLQNVGVNRQSSVVQNPEDLDMWNVSIEYCNQNLIDMLNVSSDEALHLAVSAATKW
jgi:hypothetical protein